MFYSKTSYPQSDAYHYTSRTAHLYSSISLLIVRILHLSSAFCNLRPISLHKCVKLSICSPEKYSKWKQSSFCRRYPSSLKRKVLFILVCSHIQEKFSIIWNNIKWILMPNYNVSLSVVLNHYAFINLSTVECAMIVFIDISLLSAYLVNRRQQYRILSLFTFSWENPTEISSLTFIRNTFSLIFIAALIGMGRLLLSP